MQQKIDHLRIIELLMTGKTRGEIAQELKINRSTLYRHMQGEEFKNLYADKVDSIFSEFKGLFFSVQHSALRHIHNTLKDPKTAKAEKTKIALAVIKACNLDLSNEEIE